MNELKDSLLGKDNYNAGLDSSELEKLYKQKLSVAEKHFQYLQKKDINKYKPTNTYRSTSMNFFFGIDDLLNRTIEDFGKQILQVLLDDGVMAFTTRMRRVDKTIILTLNQKNTPTNRLQLQYIQSHLNCCGATCSYTLDYIDDSSFTLSVTDRVSTDIEQEYQRYLEIKNQYNNLKEPWQSHTGTTSIAGERDELFEKAGRFIIEKQRATIGNLQRVFRINFNRAARIMDQLTDYGVVGADEGVSPRKILMTPEQFEDLVRVLPYTSLINQTATASEMGYRKGTSTVSGIKLEDDQQVSLLDNMENVLICKCDAPLRISIVKGLFNSYSTLTLQCMLGDMSSFDFQDFNDDPHLLIPIKSDPEDIASMIKWAIAEIKDRQIRFVEKRSRSISAFNENTGNPCRRLFIIINECEALLNDSAFSEALTCVLLQGRAVGVHVICFSSFSERNLSLGKNRDLIKIIPNAHSSMIQSLFAPFMEEKEESQEHENVGEIMQRIDVMDGIQFEHFCKELLSRNGFFNIKVTQSSSDYGADVTASKDDIRYVIQCKRYSGTVGEDAVREVFTSKHVYGAEIAVVLTNSTFTNAAKTLASHNSVHLWDRTRLMEMLSAY